MLNQHHRRDLRKHRSGPEPGPLGDPQLGDRVAPAQARFRRLAGSGARGIPGTADGAAAAPPRNSSWCWGVTTTAGAGAAPAPGTADDVATGPADSAGPSAIGGKETMKSSVSTHRRCTWTEPMSTAESGPPSATPNWSKTVRDNRRQPATTSGEDSFGHVSRCERPGASGHRNPITYGASEAEVIRDNRYSGDVGDQLISV